LKKTNVIDNGIDDVKKYNLSNVLFIWIFLLYLLLTIYSWFISKFYLMVFIWSWNQIFWL